MLGRSYINISDIINTCWQDSLHLNCNSFLSHLVLLGSWPLQKSVQETTCESIRSFVSLIFCDLGIR